MKSLIRKWPFWVEFVLVMAVAFGPFIFAAWQAMPHGKRAEVHFNDAKLLSMAFTEIAMGLGLVVFLKMRGYTRADFPFRFGAREWGRGILLLAFSHSAFILAILVGSSLMGADNFTAGVMKATVSVSLPVAIAVSLVNALYEELFVVGYLLRVLEKPHGRETAVVFSVFVRFLYHVYQGPIAIFSIIPLGFVFALYFVRTRNLWPLVFAHTVIDIMAFTFGGNG